MAKYKYTIEDLKEFAIKEHDGLCISEKYLGINKKYIWYCREHNHSWDATWDTIKRGSWCSLCGNERVAAARTKYTLEDLKEFAINKNGKCLSKKYKTSSDKYKWYCNKHDYHWNAVWSQIKNGTWCKHCGIEKIAEKNVKYTMEDLDNFAKVEHNGRCLSKVYTSKEDKYVWRCEKGHIWDATWGSIKFSGNWCSICAGNASKSIKYLDDFAIKEHNGRCTSTEYININEKYWWECKFGHEWEATGSNVTNNGSWCPICNNNSNKSEKQAIEILEELLDVKFKRNKRYDWLINPKTGHRLELDGYNKKLKIAVEYQGEQHFLDARRHPEIPESEVYKTQKHDQIKRKICKKKDILLLEPDYTMKTKKEIKNYYKKKLRGYI